MNSYQFNVFFERVLLRVPVDELRKRWPAKQVAATVCQQYVALFPFMAKGGSKKPTLAWVADYMHYVFDEGCFDVNTELRNTQMKPLDVAAATLNGEIAYVVVNFLFARGAKSWTKLKLLLSSHCNDNRIGGDVATVRLIKRFLDAGAKPYCHTNTRSLATITHLYQKRLSCRAVCIALLSLPRKVPPERRHVFQQCLPRDILVLIARMVWERRFEAKGAA